MRATESESNFKLKLKEMNKLLKKLMKREENE
jgi:hypothetical protein